MLVSLLFLGALFLLYESSVLSGRECVVGIYFPSTGSSSSLAQDLQKSVLWAIDYFNSSGMGIRLRPVISRSSVAEIAIRDLSAEGTEVILGGATSGMVRTLLPLCESAGKPLISPTSSIPELALADDLLYRGVHDSFGPGRFAGKLARKEGMAGYLVFSVTDNGMYGDSFTAGFTQGSGQEPLHRFDVHGSLLSPSLSMILDEQSPFDTVVLALPDRWASLVAHQLRLFFPGIRIWLAGWGRSPAVARQGIRTMDGIRQAGYFSAGLEGGDHPFLSYVRKHYGTGWDSYALEMGFRGVSLLSEALKVRGNRKEPLAVSLGKVRWIEGLSGRLPVNDKGDVVAPMRIGHIEDGMWVDETGSVRP